MNDDDIARPHPPQRRWMTTNDLGLTHILLGQWNSMCGVAEIRWEPNTTKTKCGCCRDRWDQKWPTPAPTTTDGPTTTPNAPQANDADASSPK